MMTENFVKDVTAESNCSHTCENCGKNQCSYCTVYGVPVSKNNDCANAQARANMSLHY